MIEKDKNPGGGGTQARQTGNTFHKSGFKSKYIFKIDPMSKFTSKNKVIFKKQNCLVK